MIRRLTAPANGQYPRPWMTSTPEPWLADVFVVGRNQAKGFSPELVGSHDDYLDALFNRNGRTCRGTYDRVCQATGKGPSPTRRHLDGLTALMAQQGLHAVIETNVIGDATPMSTEAHHPQHQGGGLRGTELFWALLTTIRPHVLIAHGRGTIKDLGRLLGVDLPKPTAQSDQAPANVACCLRLDGLPYEVTVITIPSLAPPGWNKWSRWAAEHLEDVAGLTAQRVSETRRTQPTPL